MNNLKQALLELPNVHVFDNSNLDAKYRLVAWKEDGGSIELHEPKAEWLLPLLPES